MDTQVARGSAPPRLHLRTQWEDHVLLEVSMAGGCGKEARAPSAFERKIFCSGTVKFLITQNGFEGALWITVFKFVAG